MKHNGKSAERGAPGARPAPVPVHQCKRNEAFNRAVRGPRLPCCADAWRAARRLPRRRANNTNCRDCICDEAAAGSAVARLLHREVRKALREADG